MNRAIVYGALLVGLGLAAGVSLTFRSARGPIEPVEGRRGGSVSTTEQSPGARETGGGGDRLAIRLQRRLELLTAKLAAEADGRHRLEQRIDGLATELAALRSSYETQRAVGPKPESLAAAPAPAIQTSPSDTREPASTHETAASMEQALVAAGIDATTATEIKRRRDGLALSEIALRNQAQREGWLDTPDFAAKMAEIDQQRTSIRDEIGDEAYDRYLAALDQPNRVAVNEVLLDSPAAAAGLQAGDVVLSYGDTRIFAPSELVTATRGGTAGENVRMEIIRQGQRFEVAVPRGPLGVSVAASRGDPGEG